jgi:lipopolysaccharide transport system ATP-binding protein
MIDVEKVTFGMQIKTEKGLPLEACNEPNLPRSMEFLYNIKKEDTFKIDWKFRCLLLPGNYYLNAGVYGAIEDFEGILCQIKDALVFKVENIENLKHSGFVKLVNDVKIAKL